MGKMKIRYVFVIVAFISLVWFVDATVTYVLTYPKYSFPGLLILHVPLPALVTRLIFSFLVGFAGYYLAHNRIQYKRMQLNLAGQEERYRMITSFSKDVLWTMNLEGYITFVSPSVERLRGFTAQEVMGEKFDETLTPGSRKIAVGLFNHFRDIMKEEPGRIPSVVTELEHITKNGGSVWAEASITTIPDGNGNPAFFLGVSRDISERKRKDVELRQSEENYRLLAETSLDFILVHDTEGYITYVNSAWLKATAYNIDEIKDLHLSDIVPGTFREMLNHFTSRREKGDTSRFLYEAAFKTSDGEQIPVEVSSAPLMVRGKPMAELITARDISERREAQNTLIENERRFRSYIENSPIPVFIIAENAVIQFVNQATAGYLGYRVEELVGKQYADLKAGDESEKVPQQLKRLISEGKLDDETRYLHSNGSEVNAMIRGTLLEDKSFLVYAVDITERIHAEKKIRETDEQIKKLNAGLEEMVKKRTAELEQANHELEAFSYSVSHDLRAPLRHIAAFAHLIEQSPSVSEQPKVKHYFDNITQAVDKMNDLINSLLSFSRMGRKSMKVATADMGKIVSVILDEMKTEISGRTVHFEVDDLGNVSADPELIRQVWYNLIANAIKFTRKEKQANVYIGKEKKHQRHVFFVRDNGAGFDSTYKDKLFGVFQRLHSETEFEGTGIGLANVRRIINRHGGEVWAEGKTGEGATFYFSIPKKMVS